MLIMGSCVRRLPVLVPRDVLGGPLWRKGNGPDRTLLHHIILNFP